MHKYFIFSFLTSSFLLLSAADKDSIARGKALYNGVGACFACHQITGKGLLPNIVPGLEKSAWVTGNEERLISIVLNGLEGKIMVNGRHYNGSMPPQAQLKDQQLADILTYIRNSFGNKASAITAEQVKGMRGGFKSNSAKKLIKKYPFPKAQASSNGISTKEIKEAKLDLSKPVLVRTWVPGASPAAIVVALPGAHYYCWDAGESRLRYVWSKGGFIQKNNSHWASNGKAVARFTGIPYYRAKNSLITLTEIFDENTTNHKKPVYDTTQAKDFPITIGGKQNGLPKYKGYRLIKDYPEFWYQSNGCDIYEKLLVTEDKKGIERQFRIESKGQSVQFQLTPQSTAKISANKGQLMNGLLKLSSEEAKSFSIIIKEVD